MSQEKVQTCLGGGQVVSIVQNDAVEHRLSHAGRLPQVFPCDEEDIVIIPDFWSMTVIN